MIIIYTGKIVVAVRYILCMYSYFTKHHKSQILKLQNIFIRFKLREDKTQCVVSNKLQRNKALVRRYIQAFILYRINYRERERGRKLCCHAAVSKKLQREHPIVRLTCLFAVNVASTSITLQLTHSLKYQFASTLAFQLGDILPIWELKKYVSSQQ